MNYLVGSDPVLLCRLTNLNLTFNASLMTIKPPLRYPSTRKLNITVMDDYVIKLTLNNATTQDSNTYYCKGPPNGSLTLDSVVVNVGCKCYVRSIHHYVLLCRSIYQYALLVHITLQMYTLVYISIQRDTVVYIIIN